MPDDDVPRGEATHDNAMVAAHQMALLGVMRIPAVALNRDSSVVDLTPDALDLLDDDLRLCSHRLVASDRDSNERLQALILAAFDGDARRPPCTHTVVVRRQRRPLLVSLIGRQSYPESTTGSFTILLLVNTDLRPGPDQTVLRAAFGLTASEARLAEYIATGGSLEDAATKFGITRGTAAKKLKFIFEKTDTHRQAELVSLLTRFTILNWFTGGDATLGRFRGIDTGYGCRLSAPEPHDFSQPTTSA